MLSGKEEWGNLLISAIVVSGAFTVQDISPGFFLICFAIVFLSYLAHSIAHEALSRYEGMETKTGISGVGVLMAIATGILSGGLAVIAAPMVMKVRRVEEGTWMKKVEASFERYQGLVSMSGPLINLVIGTAFLGLHSFFATVAMGVEIFWLISLVNFWIGVSHLIPYHPFDGGNVAVWTGWGWFMALVTGGVGISGLLFFV